MQQTAEKPFDFGAVSSTPEQHEAGTWVKIMRLDRPDEPSGFEILLAGSESQRMRDVARQWADEARARGDQKLTDAEQSDLLRRQDMDVLVAATIDWRYPKGFSGPVCSKDEAAKLYTKFVDIRRQVSQKLNFNARFLAA